MTTLAALAIATSSVAASRQPAIKLINRLAQIQKQGVMIGHQDDPMYGCSWSWEEGRSDVKEVCGDYPAVMGFDLGDLELGKDKTSTACRSTVCARKSSSSMSAAAS